MNGLGQPECAYCFEATGTVRARRILWDPDEDGVVLCLDCWHDVQVCQNGRI